MRRTISDGFRHVFGVRLYASRFRTADELARALTGVAALTR